MEILIIDGTYDKLKCFLYKDNKVVKKFESELNNVFLSLDKIFSEFRDVSFIGINKGPGSFTSTRASLAYVKGYSLARKIPIVAISSFDVLKEMGKPEIVSAGRGNIFIKKGKSYKIISDEEFLPYEIDYDIFFEIIKRKIKDKEFDNPLYVLPLYIKTL
ncbi:MAG: hypothetical protein ACYDBX_02470 [Patescibacteria group bacterium]